MNNDTASKRIEEQIAARRPKLTKEEAKRRRELSMRRFKLLDLISVLVLTGVLLYIQSQFFVAASPDAPSAMLFNTFLLYCGAVALQVAIMICATFMRYNQDRFMSEDKSDHLIKGLRWTYFTPLIALALLLPALFAGVLANGEMSAAGTAGLALVAIVLSLILAPLISAFILTPIILIWKGMVAVVRGDTTQKHLGIVGLLIAGLTAFILIGSAAVAPAAPFPVGSVQVVFAILGIPGDYQIQSEVYLWIIRAIVVFYIAVFIYGHFVSRKTKAPAASKK